MKHQRSLRSLVVLLLAAALTGAPARAQDARLSEDLARTWAGRVGPLEVTPGGRVVYALSPSLTAPFELRSAPLDASHAPLALSPPPVLGATVESLRLDPTGTRATFLVDLVDVGEHELYSVPVDGSQAAVRISHSPPLGLVIAAYLVTPDAARVIYVAFEGFTLVNRIYSVPLAGGPVIELSASFPGETSVLPTFAFAANGRVVFLARDPTDLIDLWSAPADGSSSPVRLNLPLPPGGEVLPSFQLTPDGVLALYVADQDANNVFELYRVPTDGSAAAVKLSGTLVAGGDVSLVSGLRISADGLRAVFTADALADERVELFSVPTDASAPPLRLNGALVAGGNVSTGFRISPDGTRVVYLADQAVDGVRELFSVPIDGSAAAVRLNGPLVPGGDVSGLEGGFVLSPDGARVVYLADQASDGVDELYSVPLDGSAPATRLDPPLAPGGDVVRAVVAPDSARVAFLADAEEDGAFRVLVAPIDGGPVAELGVPCGANASDFRFDAQGTHVLYTVQHAGASPPVELLSAPSDGSLAPVSPAFEPAVGAVSGDVEAFVASPDGHRIVYSAAVEGFPCEVPVLLGVSLDGPYASRRLSGAESAPDPRLITPDGRVLYTASPDGLYSAPLDGSSPPLLLAPLVAAGELESLSLAPDGVTVLFIGRALASDPLELHTARADTALSASRLSSTLVANGRVTDFQLDPHGEFVVYRADQRADEVYELFVVPLDRSRAPLRVSGALVAGGDVVAGTLAGWRIALDGRSVVYLADARIDDMFELFRAALDSAPYVRRPGAPRPLVRLDRGLVAGGDVLEFQLAPDAATVVYRADQDQDERFELYRVALDGGTPPVPLNPPLVAGGDVASGFALAPDGTRVVYRADQAVDERIELWSVPLAGGAALRLNAPLTDPRDVTEFRIAPDSARAVYLAQQVSLRPDLYSVPVDGSQAPVPLHPPLLAGRSIAAFRIAARGDSVVFLSDLVTDECFELFAAPLDGGHPPVRVSEPLTPAGDVVDFELTPDGNRVVYRADQRADERYELFVGYLSPPYRQGR